jgi:2-polyprenyl-6-methoxyphenol hydroxylase-like FAD-dependent oxidoreductase
MSPANILIVGGGVAGPTLASLLLLSDIPAPQKPHITILERSSTLSAHTRGQNIDIRGAGVTIIRKLGLEGIIRASTTGEEGVQLVDQYGRVWSSSRADRSGRIQTPTSDIEILRGRLAEICWKGSQRISSQVEKEGGKQIEYIFGEHVANLEQHGSKIYAYFAKSGEKRAYDIVVGADGVQSQTRKLVWGEDGDKARANRIGMYAGFFSIPREEHDSKWRKWYHAPGRRGVMLRPDDRGLRSTIFMYVINDRDPRLVEVAEKGHEGFKAQKALLEEHFADAGWECDRILREMKKTDDFHYDMIAQIKMDSWSKGRTVLLGDAG